MSATPRRLPALLVDAQLALHFAHAQWHVGDAPVTADLLRTALTRIKAAQSIALGACTTCERS